jgi:hydrogenase nickel incorporation protein HypB
MAVITIERKVLEKNDAIARQNRDLFVRNGIFAVNLVSSPGAGKTSLLERTIEHLRGTIPLAVIEGDVQTDLDAQRVARYGVPAVQIVTLGGCHLEANLIRDALASISLEGIKLLIIENVGNLVCPSNYDLGEAMKIVIASTTEGDDKPLKYPAMFRNASAIVINKIDLVPYVNADPAVLRRNALQINPSLRVFETSCTTGKGIAEWCQWLQSNTRA